ncbi:response regulator receiver domain [Paenibacillus sp. Y412MC10]|uniref:response regulator receiver domain n=1 Tax=Geobacillus sp. (strain Y412MC10) TaxID=481743 RepID=UPI0011AB7D95|nr:response regulator receiver domain [Paenibacillus sp. Y412MC10]
MSSTSEISYVNHIVKDYFNSILIIDDQLDLDVKVFEETTELDLSNIDYDSVNSALLIGAEEDSIKAGINETAVAATPALPIKKYTLQPEASYHTELMEEGFVTTPFRYNSTIPVAQVDVLSNLLSTIKLLIVDWDLENSKTVEPGEAASAILQKYTSFDKGLKCAVIYTASDDFDGIMEYLSDRNLITKRDGVFFENISDTGHKLFGFIISKNHFKAKQIIPVISQKLLADKSLVLHFMDTAARINNNISRAMLDFSAPFEKVIFSQIITAKIPENDIPRFLTDKFLGIIMENKDDKYQYNFIVENKITSLKNAIATSEFLLDKVIKLILEIGSDTATKKALINQFRDSRFVSQLVAKIQNHQQGLQLLEEEICGLVENIDMKRDLFLVIMLWDEFLKEKGVKSLQEDLRDALRLYPFNEENYNKISSFFNKKLSGQFKRIILEKDIINADLLEKYVDTSFEDFKTEFMTTISNFDDDKEKLINLLILWPAFFGEDSEFSNSYKKQIYNFTKLMKFNDSTDDRIETGAMYYQESNDTYLLCITPFCDTFNTNKVDSYLKFLLGRVEPNPIGDRLKNSDTPNCFYMAVPSIEDEKVKIIKWNFYEVITMHEDDVKSEKLKKMLYLRKEYIQNVLNRYIAYQSRAGVDELFFKESNYINNFINFL